MFTGIIKEVGTISEVREEEGSRVFRITAELSTELSVDASISINGACHTVIDCNASAFSVQSVDETLRKTTLGALSAGDPVNLERAMSPRQLLNGHIVQGHVDTTGTIAAVLREGSDHLLTISHPREYAALVVGRGSICVDGVSLTVADLAEDRFTVAVIPFTLEHTTLGRRRTGDPVNLEFDILGKYVARHLEQQGTRLNRG